MNDEIPKIIHYCWFGKGKIPKKTRKYIKSWKKWCPDYEIKCWTEDDFDINMCSFTKQAYKNKKWAFVSDVARLYILKNYGGIYLDTDVQIIKNLDILRKKGNFLGFEYNLGLNKYFVAAGVIAANKNNKFVSDLLNEYLSASFSNDDDTENLKTIPIRITQKFVKDGLKCSGEMQKIDDFIIYPRDYFYPEVIHSGFPSITEKTYSIHHYEGTWLTAEERIEVLNVKNKNKIDIILNKVKAPVKVKNLCKKILYKILLKKML